MSDPWVVSIRGCAGSISFEIAVVRASNKHGLSSYGWFDERKLLVTHNGGPCKWPLTEIVWDKQVALAQSVAEELNATEDSQ